MTFPEHVVCSATLAQYGLRQRFGRRGVLLLVLAGFSPDLDTAAKLVADQTFWQLHHALGHNVWAVLLLAAACTLFGRVVLGIPLSWSTYGWCLAAAVAHCLTDSLYWWGIQPLWPFSRYELKLSVLEYLDLVVLTIWLTAAVVLWCRPDWGCATATVTLAVFLGYVAVRASLPPPTGWWKFLTGGWIYAPPRGTPVLDWWNWW